MDEVRAIRRLRLDRGRLRRQEGMRLRPSVRGLAGRFAVGAAIFVVAGLVGNRWGPVLGGLSLALPAVLAATLTRIEARERRAQDAKRAILGAAGLIGFAGCVWGLAVTLPAWLTLLIATAVWAVIADVLYLNSSSGRRLGADGPVVKSGV
ncbi:hypothetical protein FDA94_26355 [Herbidospora galbida]|uniref:DUF3147 family protein n=1 Tax=Herbidospora galbida TaxID=2575442 RepID=A0A4U3M9E2_9ACTN|nr:hypothetical protein [Herbidospora galbida]TKK85200.1 hypothetical protein FDA94_26355 [Herbidospora galbida]